MIFIQQTNRSEQEDIVGSVHGATQERFILLAVSY